MQRLHSAQQCNHYINRYIGNIRKRIQAHLLPHEMRMGIISATMGVLFRKAEATMTGIIMRTCAQNTVLALPSMKFIARSSPAACIDKGTASSRTISIKN